MLEMTEGLDEDNYYDFDMPSSLRDKIESNGNIDFFLQDIPLSPKDKDLQVSSSRLIGGPEGKGLPGGTGLGEETGRNKKLEFVCEVRNRMR